MPHPGPNPSAFDYLLHPQETALQVAKRQVWVTEERIDYLLCEMLSRRGQSRKVDDPVSLNRLTLDLLVLESLRTLLHTQQLYVQFLEEVEPQA